ncbi:hypothetical protein, partial [Streptomyces sp. H27-H5]|uniref:hypothetical protein n=1 Tax=Streptomyces sp. H27-H5 TaxID=2996460 RepID=UPI002270A60E
MTSTFESQGLNIRANIDNIPPDDEGEDGVSVNFGDDTDPYLANVSEGGTATAPHQYANPGTYTITAICTETGTQATVVYHAEGTQLGLSVVLGTGANWNKGTATVTGLAPGTTAKVAYQAGATEVETAAAGPNGEAKTTDNAVIYPSDVSNEYTTIATAPHHPNGSDTVTTSKPNGDAVGYIAATIGPEGNISFFGDTQGLLPPAENTGYTCVSFITDPATGQLSTAFAIASDGTVRGAPGWRFPI